MSYAHSLDRIHNLGLPSEIAKPILAQVDKWLVSCGPEWTVGRLKELKQWFIHSLCGKEYKPNGSWCAEKDGIPKGCFKPLFLMKPSRKVFNTLLIYTGFTSARVTPKQERKFFDSVCAEPIDTLPHIPYLKHVVESLNQYTPDRVQSTYVDYGWTDTKRAPKSDMTTVPESIEVLFEDFKSTLVWDLLDDSSFERIILDAMGNLTPRLLKIQDEEEYGDFVGRVSVVQEPGYKARFLANPRRVFQIALRPMGRQLLSLLNKIPWDCTHNQLKGATWARDQLRAGRVVYSVDLSDATNNFPWILQKRVLRWLEQLDTEDIRLLDTLVKGDWFVPEYLTPTKPKPTNNERLKRKVSWTKGQPLGLYPSFPAFAFTHGCLLRAIELKIGVSDTFRVLGDDVVISDADVHQEYRRYLNLFRMPVSESKTITSNIVAEFAGILITCNGFYTGVKWRQPNSNRKLHLLSSLTRCLDLTDRQEFFAYVLKSAPRPYGQGNNPEGLPLKARAALFRPWLLEIQRKADYTQLERPTVDELWFKSSLSQEVHNSPWKRDDLEAELAAIERVWNETHPYTQIKDRDAFIRDVNRKVDSVGPLKFWFRLMRQFNFIDCQCPNALIKGGWLKSGTGLTYMIQCIDDQVERLRSRNVIGRWLQKLLVQEQTQWYKLSTAMKEKALEEAILAVLEDRDL